MKKLLITIGLAVCLIGCSQNKEERENHWRVNLIAYMHNPNFALEHDMAVFTNNLNQAVFGTTNISQAQADWLFLELEKMKKTNFQ